MYQIIKKVVNKALKKRNSIKFNSSIWHYTFLLFSQSSITSWRVSGMKFEQIRDGKLLAPKGEVCHLMDRYWPQMIMN